MSFHRASKKEEKEFKEYTITAKEQTVPVVAAEEGQKTDVKGLEKALLKKDTSLTIFANADESYRKRVLKEEYSELKTKYGWKYDQQIKSDE